MPRILKQDAQKMLGNVPNEYAFMCCDGRILTNMLELGAALGTMSDEIFAYHVNQAKNDFTSWVRNIIKDDKLASDLLKATNQKQAAYRVAERVGASQEDAGLGFFKAKTWQ